MSGAGDRPVQVGSHYHFVQANPALAFDRDAAWGHRLNLALENGLAERLRLAGALVPVADVSGRGKADMINNDALPNIRVEPDTFTVRIDGEVTDEAPAAELPMAQRYFLF